METATFTITMSDEPGSSIVWRETTTEDGVLVEDTTITVPSEHVPAFAELTLEAALFAFDVGVDEVDNLVTSAELAAVEASFPTGAQVDAEDELRSRLTAEGITHGNF